MENPKPKLEAPTHKVEFHTKGKVPVSWRKDPIILARLTSVAEMFLRGGTLLNIAAAFNYSLATAKRDIARVKTLWREQFHSELLSLRDQSIAQYKLVITRAWSEYGKHPNANFLRIIVDAQSKIDDIQGNRAPMVVQVGALDIEAVRQKRWQDIQKMLPDILNHDGEDG